MLNVDKNEEVKKELIEKLKSISTDRDFVLAIINIARTVEDRKEIIHFIGDGDDATDENTILFALALKEARGDI